MSRLFHFIYILYFFEVGIFLILLPWFKIWDNNALLHRFPFLKTFALSGYFKGIIIGLGIANILMGIVEVLEIRRRRHDEYFHR